MFNDAKAERIRALYKRKDFTGLHQGLLATLQDFNRKVYTQFTRESLRDIDCFIEVFFWLLQQTDFTLGRYVDRYLSYCTLIENLAYLSSATTTAGLLRQFSDARAQDLQKVLLVMNLKNNIDFDFIDNLFRHNSALASYWLCSVYTRHCFCHDTVMQNLMVLQQKLPGYDLYPFDSICSIYFNATYVNPGNHVAARKKINDTIRKYVPLNTIQNTARPGQKPRIAIASKNWNKEHAVYRCIGAFVESLRESYDLVHIQLDPAAGEDRFIYFSKVYPILHTGKFIDYSSISANDFNLVIFPDVGLNTESLILANLRIAPVQVALYGHPVTTASDQIDYFFTGALSETQESGDCYTEHLLELQGTGMNSVHPGTQRPSLAEKKSSLAEDILHIYLTASPPKINCFIKYYWKSIADASKKPVVFHLLPGDYGMQEVSVLRYDLEACIGRERLHIHSTKKTAEYLAIIQQCHFALGSYHYGDYNRIIDCLWTGTPVIVVSGNCGYRNTGAGALRALGLEDLIVNDLDAYVARAVALLHDAGEQSALQERILNLPLEGTLICNRTTIDDFKRHIARLLEEVR